MAFSPEYIRLVLSVQFEDAKTLVLDHLLAIHEAHLVMLAECGILTRPVARRLRDGLKALDLEAIRRTPYAARDEDLFFHVDRTLAQICGDDIAGRLHTARSRNDIDMTVYRMAWRGWLLDIADRVVAVRHALLAHADRHRESIFAAHTHTQPAQPTTLAHYLLAVVEQLERDQARIEAAFRTVNRCPLGACAITGTGFPIDRARTSNLLGFDAPTGNTYGSIATADYVLESAAALNVLVVGIGRVAQDLLLWATTEFGYIRLADSLVQTSSIMPQKRNPVALEHVRALASKASAELSGLPLVMHNTPFGDIVDTEDDVQPLAAEACRDTARATALLATVLDGLTFETARMRASCLDGRVTVTELADTLTRDHGVPFRTGHAIAARLALTLPDLPPGGRADAVMAAGRALGVTLSLDEAEVARALDPENFVQVRKTPGGPSPETTKAAIRESVERLERDQAAISSTRGAISEAIGRRQAGLEVL